MPRNGKLPVLNLLTNQKSGFSIRPAEATRCTDSRKTWHGRLSSGSAWLYKISPHSVRGVGMRPQNIKISTFWSTVASQGRTLWPISKFFRGFYTLNYPALAFQISLDSYHRLRSYCWETASRLIRPNFSVHPLGKTMRWIEKWMNLFDGLDELYRRTKFGGDRTTRAGCRCENVVFVTMFFLSVTLRESGALWVFEGCIVRTSIVLPFIGRFRWCFQRYFHKRLLFQTRYIVLTFVARWRHDFREITVKNCENCGRDFAKRKQSDAVFAGNTKHGYYWHNSLSENALTYWQECPALFITVWSDC